MKPGRWIRPLLIVLGLCLCALPALAGRIEAWQDRQSIRTRQMQLENVDQSMLQDSLEQARDWNRRLISSAGQPADRSYEEQLNLLSDGVMGILHVPAIDLSLPIVHGTSSEALSGAVGHLESSALPVGTDSSRCVLSAHRGLAGALLFTRLDELENGDVFWIENPLEKLAYQVEDIRVIEPDGQSALAPETGRDLVTLMTCTPYGINSHRLLVTGARCEMPLAQSQKIVPRPPGGAALLLETLPWIVSGLVLMILAAAKLKRKRRI